MVSWQNLPEFIIAISINISIVGQVGKYTVWPTLLTEN
ncbi:hypothetical protein HMPREF9952_0168 [Haemophilus pittmaniae HK 85]|uniref:Uncharacterized protein n=1 Tax=Haemophilus pittmaniae HK 85 TaxID=1035188 RepID=F9Q7C4_9PAST|nr:hypothetical protein HMPREF9952_0168 [Haemophilus pittmaniae HK 85]